MPVHAIALAGDLFALGVACLAHALLRRQRRATGRPGGIPVPTSIEGLVGALSVANADEQLLRGTGLGWAADGAQIVALLLLVALAADAVWRWAGWVSRGHMTDGAP